MSDIITCPQGHKLEFAEAPTLPLVCPTCGSTVQVLPGVRASEVMPPIKPDVPLETDETLVRPLPAAASAPAAPVRPPSTNSIQLEDTFIPTAAQAAAELGGADDPSASMPNYEILDLLGRGGMGIVYKARQRSLNRIVALKMILVGVLASPKELKRFRSEAESIAQLQHPNIVQIFEVGELHGLPHFALEYVAGGTLAAQLKDKPFEPRAAARLVQQLASGVEAAHQHGIIHRDLKPANVLLTLDGIPKITDFGLALRLDQDANSRTNSIQGTPAFMSPEQALGKSELGPASDVYSLGAILYQLLTGQPPFVSKSLMRLLDMLEKKEAVPPRALNAAVPPELEAICLKCLEKQPARRYASAQELADDLGRFLPGEPVKARPLGPALRLLKWARRRPAAAGLLALLLLGGLAVAIHGYRNIEIGALVNRPPPTAPGPTVGADHSDAKVRAVAQRSRQALVQVLLQAKDNNGWFVDDIAPGSARVIEIMSHALAIRALLADPDLSSTEAKSLLPSMGLPFHSGVPIERNGIAVGWRASADVSYTSAAPAACLASMLATAYRRPGLLNPDERQRTEQRLRFVQDILHNHEPVPFDGGWNMFPRQKSLARHNSLATTTTLSALLDCRQAGLPWRGSESLRDELLKKTVNWLVDVYEPTATPPGWHYGRETADAFYDGLTLMIYGLLLRADIEAGIPLPQFMWTRLPQELARYVGRPIDASEQQRAEALYYFLDAAGQEQVGRYILRIGWYPWTVRCCALWLQLANSRSASPADIALVKRVLGYLVVELGPQAAKNNVNNFTLTPIDRLYALDIIPPPEPDRE